MNLDNKVVVISGGASGLGWETARYCVSERNARVVLIDSNAEAGQHCARTLGEDRALFVPADISDQAQVAAAVERAEAHWGGIHACFSFAGVVGPMRILDKDGMATATRSFCTTVNINLVGTFYLLAHCAQAMTHNAPDEDGERGVLITIASGAAFDGQVGQSAYAASKAGLVGLSLPAARELAAWGIRVNSVAPGAFMTPMMESLPGSVQQRISDQFQFPKRFGKPAEIAALCIHIAENPYINGEYIRLDGAFRLPPR